MRKIAFCDEEPETISLAEHSKRKNNLGKLPVYIKKQRHLDEEPDPNEGILRSFADYLLILIF